MSKKTKPGFTPKWLKDLSDLNRKAWHNQPEFISLLRQKCRPAITAVEGQVKP